MAVKNGYKQTEVGEIPEDWDVVPVSQKGKVVTGKALAVNAPGRQRPYLRTKNVFDGRIVTDDVLTMPMTDEQFTQFQVRSGDVLLNEGQSLELVGRCSIYQGEYPEPCAIQNALLRFRSFADASAKYASYLFRYCQQTGVFAKIALQTTSIAHLGGSRLERLPLAWPPTKAEQEAIAEALSDADALIESLEQLIAKKRQIKQGAMQQLLTGQKRLPGFSGDWGKAVLEEVADCLDNLRVPLNDAERQKRKGSIPYCGANGVLDYINDYVVDDDVILMAEDGGYFDEYMYRPIAYRMTGKCWVNNHAHILKAKQDTDQGFLFYSLVHKNLMPFIASGTRAKLNRSELNKIEVTIPGSKAEQTAIAETLSDMDEEIAALEAKLSKARQLKQGMMPELLTGKTRLL
ncbi:restriction endonuclease subunit S [Pelagicoccus sp. SDUM812003]|uniref:restriction endonuclease subunit S n=1 Tax=Pelagicoccus sp. SDUM812003 TaxID=3041267 RepID=UPI00280E2891|nr:restriction endonuclease subunit S [Pelagicoccus sp. SDUM812003]MDQ8201494.1 restriction endonuclease subunit S [Pelagicoccus sp. SDUM812003]